MRISTFMYSIKQGVKNIYRNRLFSLASVGTITACLFIFGIFYFVVSNFQYMLQAAETSVGVTVFFEEGLSEYDIANLKVTIERRPEVSKVNYISAEEAWESYKANYLKPELAETFNDDNPLADSASFEVYIQDVSKQKALVNYIKTLSGIRQVNSSDVTAASLESFNSLVGYISGAILIILLAVAIFLISTTVTMGISVRKEEIAIMRMIGATDFFIRAPFIVEGVVIGFVGSAIPLVFLYFMYNRVVTFVMERFNTLANILTFLGAKELFSSLIPISLLIGVGIGFIGSFITVRRHLNV